MSDDLSRVPTRRRFLGVSGAALAAAAMVPLAPGQQVRSKEHNQPNEEQPGENNNPLDAENPSSVWSPETDNGTVEPFKYSFALAHKRIEAGGWTRQVSACRRRFVPVATLWAHWSTSRSRDMNIPGSCSIRRSSSGSLPCPGQSRTRILPVKTGVKRSGVPSARPPPDRSRRSRNMVRTSSLTKIWRILWPE